MDKGQHIPWKEPTDEQFLTTDGTPFDRHTQLAEHAAADIASRS
jgi:hypothetical protein